MTLPRRMPGLLEATRSIVRILLTVPSGSLSIKTPLAIDLMLSLDFLDESIAFLVAFFADLISISLSEPICFCIDFTRFFIAVSLSV